MSLYFSPSRKLAAKRLKEGGPRIYDPRERLLLAAFDRGLRLVAPFTRLPPAAGPLPDPAKAERVLLLRLDRLGDLVMTFPALAALRSRLPRAHLTLAVGSWNEELARGLPFVDQVAIVDLPSSAWGRRASWREAVNRLRALGTPDLALDFQGDVRALLLMAAGGATLRAGYADTGGRSLLTHVGRWDERVSWYRQSFELLRAVLPETPEIDVPDRIEPYNFLLPEDRRHGAEAVAATVGASPARPLIGLHPSAGRAIKAWEVGKWAALADRLVEKTRGTVLLTGAASDRALVDAVAARARPSLAKLASGGGIRAFAGALGELDLFVTGDTGPMHLAHAVGAPTLALFGPSDPVRYGPEGESPRRRVARVELYCSPCNMIRRPPRECAAPEAPPCLSSLSVDQVVELASELLLLPPLSHPLHL